MKADGKHTVIIRRGRTSDIVNVTVSVFREDWAQVCEIAPQFRGPTVADTLVNIGEYLQRNIKYRLDPHGQQWIKTPARFVSDGCGDCKSYSVFTVSVLTALGIKGGFRFVSYKPGDYTHVYAFAIDEHGKRIPLDVVAHIQAATPFLQELKYIDKKDIMNTTQISRLSGIGDAITAEALEGAIFSNTATVAANFVNSCLLLAKNENEYLYYKYLIDGIKEFGKDANNLRIFFKFLNYYNIKGLNETHYMRSNIFDATRGAISEFAQQGRYTAPTTAGFEPEEIENYEALQAWAVNNIIQELYVKSNTIANAQGFGQDICMCFYCFLYVLIDERKLNAAQLKKRKAQLDIIEKCIVPDLNFNTQTVINLLHYGCLYYTRLTPLQLFEAINKYKITPTVSGICSTELAPQTPLTEPGANVNNSAVWVDKWVTLSTDTLVKIFGSLSQVPRKSDGSYYIPYPVYKDYTAQKEDNTILYIALGGLALLAVLALKKKK